MKHVLAVAILLLSAALAAAQRSSAVRPSPSPLSASTAAEPDLDSILADIQRSTEAANSDITRLRIDRWKADTADKAQLQQVADSLHKNIAFAVPDLITEVRSSRGSVSSTFKLYHNINVVFEYLNSLTDAAGSLGKREEYDPLNSDTAALDKARQQLSSYIERAAASLENKVRMAAAAATPTPTPQATPKKIVVDDDTPSKKPVSTKKKKTSKPAPQATPSPK